MPLNLSSFKVRVINQHGYDFLSSMIIDPEGVVHVADDGVARSYNATNGVIDYAPLSNEQLMRIIFHLPPSMEEHHEHLMQVFDGVDGHAVTDKKQILEPPAWLQPVSFNTSTQPQSRSEAQEAAAALLDKRQPPFCSGQRCTTTRACRTMGCSVCAFIDLVISGPVCVV